MFVTTHNQHPRQFVPLCTAVTYLTLSDCKPRPRPRRFQQSGKGRPRVGRAREKRAEHGKRHRGRSSSSGRISERGFPFLIFTRLKSVRQMDRRKGRTDPRHRRTTDSISAPQSCDRPDCEARSRVRLCCGYFAIDACCDGSLARRSGVTIDLH